MELRLLRYFVATADYGTVSAAARQLRAAQPSVSRQLRQLERQLGVDLFERAGGRLHLSTAGRQFLPVARDLVQRADSAQKSASMLANNRLVSISIAAPITTLTDVVAPFVSTFGADDPVPSVIEWTMADDLGPLLLNVDLAIVPLAPAHDLEREYVATFPLWAYVKPDHDWAHQPSVTLEELVTQPVIVSTTQFKSRRVLDSAVENAGLAFCEEVETSNGQVAQALAAAGRGNAVVTDDPQFDLVPLKVMVREEPLRVHLHGCWRRDHYASTSLRQMSARLREFCARRYGPQVIEGS